MKKLLLILALAVMCNSVTRAEHFDDIDDGMEAYLKRDYATALKLFRPLAEQGYASAQHSLGVMYANGEGVTQDYKKAVEWYRLAAEQGDGEAQNNLGLMYTNGEGVIQDYVLAHSWFNLAASNRSEKGSKNRDKVSTLMTASQISEAQDMARGCLKKNYKNCE